MKFVMLRKSGTLGDVARLVMEYVIYSARAPDEHHRQLSTPTTTTTKLQRVKTQPIWT